MQLVEGALHSHTFWVIRFHPRLDSALWPLSTARDERRAQGLVIDSKLI